jgi:hypothetical protein
VKSILNIGQKNWQGSLIIFALAMALFSCISILGLRFYQLLHQQGEDGQYFILTKQVALSNTLLGQIPSFNSEEIQELRVAPFTEKIAQVQQPQFQSRATFFEGGAFKTELAFEAMPDDMIDSPGYQFYWRPGMKKVPILISSEFLRLYNFVYAPMAGLPSVQEDGLAYIPIKFNMNNGRKNINIQAEVVGLSHRFQGVFVPISFMQWANDSLSSGKHKIGKMLVSVKPDAVSEFEKFTKDKGYDLNKEQMRLSKIGSIIFPFVLIVQCLLIIMLTLALSNFWLHSKNQLYQQLENIRRLYLLGYNIADMRLMIFKGLYKTLLFSSLAAGIMAVIGFFMFGIFTELMPEENLIWSLAYVFIIPLVSFMLISVVFWTALKDFCSRHYA